MGPLGVSETILLFIIALLVFGPKRLPELGRTFGKALAEFRRASSELRNVVEDEVREMERHTAEARAATEAALTVPDDRTEPASPPQDAAPAPAANIVPGETSRADDETPAHGQAGTV